MTLEALKPEGCAVGSAVRPGLIFANLTKKYRPPKYTTEPFATEVFPVVA